MRYARYASESKHPELWRGLVGMWSPRFTGPIGLVLHDLSPGPPNNGDMTNMSASTDWVVGEKGWVNAYPGSNEYIDMGDVLDMGLNSWTVSVWIKTANSANFQGIVSKSPAGNIAGRWAVVTQQTTGFIEAVFQGTAMVTTQGVTDVTDNEWHYITVTWNRNGDTNIYVDGEFENSSDISGQSGSDLNGSTTLKIGAGTASDQVTPNIFFNGRIEDTFIYDIALPENRIKDMFAGAHPLTPKRRRVVKAPVSLMAMERSMSRRVHGRVFGRVN